MEFSGVPSTSVRLTPDGTQLFVVVPGGITSGPLRLIINDLVQVFLGNFTLIEGRIYIPCSGSPPTYTVEWSPSQPPAELTVGTLATVKNVDFINGKYTPGHWADETVTEMEWRWHNTGFKTDSIQVGSDGTKVWAYIRGSYASDICTPALGETVVNDQIEGIFNAKGKGGDTDGVGGPLPETIHIYDPGDEEPPTDKPFIIPDFPWNPHVFFPDDQSDRDGEIHGEVTLDAPDNSYQLLNYVRHSRRNSIPTLCQGSIIVAPAVIGSPTPEVKINLGLSVWTVDCTTNPVQANLSVTPTDMAIADAEYDFYAEHGSAPRKKIASWPYTAVKFCGHLGTRLIAIPRTQTPPRLPRPVSLALKYQPIKPASSKISARAIRVTELNLLPLEIMAFKRGTLNTPGKQVHRGHGEFGYETVMMENGDDESAETSVGRDCIQTGNLSDYRKANDDDLVKIVLKWPAGVKPAGASLKLLHDGMEVNAKKKTAKEAVGTRGPSRLKFYKADGTLLNNLATDLQIADLANPPTDHYLSKVIKEGEVTLFIEGADQFGDLPSSKADRLGGAILKWEFQTGETKVTDKLLVYRGGFLQFLQPANAPGTVGSFEFRDGKGRIRHTFGGFGKEFASDETDLGDIIATWTAKSGKTLDNPDDTQRGGPYNENGRNGHTPPGWWSSQRRADFSGKQNDQRTGTGAKTKIRQGWYVRWKQDDEINAEARYTTIYRYDASKTHDAANGEPTPIKFKYDLFPISPGTAQSRTDIQIHPDGECTDPAMGGTAGCIGIQTYKGCDEVLKTIENFHSLRIKVLIK